MDAVRELDIFMAVRLSTSNQKKLEMLSKHFKDIWRVVVNITRSFINHATVFKATCFPT